MPPSVYFDFDKAEIFQNLLRESSNCLTHTRHSRINITVVNKFLHSEGTMLQIVIRVLSRPHSGIMDATLTLHGPTVKQFYCFI